MRTLAAELENQMDNGVQTEREITRLGVDLSAYMNELDGVDLTPEQAAEVLGALFEIMVQFVDLGIGVHALQIGCGKESEIVGDVALKLTRMVDSEERNQSKGGCNEGEF